MSELMTVTVRPGSVVEDSTISVEATAISSSQYEVSYQPQTQGKHQLSVKVNSTHIAGSLTSQQIWILTAMAKFTSLMPLTIKSRY